MNYEIQLLTANGWRNAIANNVKFDNKEMAEKIMAEFSDEDCNKYRIKIL